MKHTIYLLAALLLAACSEPAVETPPAAEPAVEQMATASVSETERINAWFEEKNEEQLQFSPIQLTVLGRKELYDQIDDM